MADHSRWDTADYRHWLDIFGHNSTSVYNRTGANPYPGHNNGASKNNSMIVDENRCRNHFEEWRLRIVTRSKN